eukprot:XP_001709017.1 Hypothetical protein GL50803_20815 [Giardia lamblia ATCC 50803]
MPQEVVHFFPPLVFAAASLSASRFARRARLRAVRAFLRYMNRFSGTSFFASAMEPVVMTGFGLTTGITTPWCWMACWISSGLACLLKMVTLDRYSFRRATLRATLSSDLFLRRGSTAMPI